MSRPSAASALGEARATARPLDIRTFHQLRTTVEQGLAVHWRTDDELAVDVAARWLHLPPPRDGGGPGGDAWRRGHHFGQLYLRWGPDFCMMRDRRPGEDASMIVVDDSELLRCIRLLEQVSDHACEMCRELDQYGLVFTQGAWRTLAPVRLRRPPIPFSGI